MGKGGRADIPTKSSIWQSKYKPLDPSAPKLPSKGEIKAAIPKECFERSALHSFYFVFRDSVMAAALVFAAYTFLSTDVPSEILSLDMLKWIVGWNLYAFWQGTVLTGHWVLAHECGHGAFSSSQFLNDIVGYIIHQALLVPYFAWQYTHAKHHRRTNHLLDGESHVPSTGIENGLGPNNERLSFYAVIHEALGDGAFAGFQVFTHLVVGWPLYLLGLASTGRLDANGKPLEEGDVIDHFRPGSKMFPAKLEWKIALSTLGVIGTLGGLLKLSLDYGFLTVFLWYGAPYMWTNAWLVLYTWLQHTDPSVPQYGSEEWTWVKGALSTIDRPYGIFDFFHHKIGSTHVAHHLFHEMPFYKADVATAAIKEFLGPLYNYDPTPWYQAMWRIARTCHYVEGTNGIQYYKSLEDIPLSSSSKAKAE
uniref:Fatty acid desaturase domain-containing protein n=1 Tax=Leptocylindrus danicus TaxID=163516 RepID=A0A6U2R511_9STRA|mmetsp:Transcript_33671/g.48756  ORF Transcript_33671/g.48756 Transcript_33671/m.48756 type:complete len:421 (+) Transcript_33671:107-1369(+)